MLSTNELLNGLPPELTLRFFATFARFEFALKQSGYLRNSEPGQVAEADKERLADRLGTAFFEGLNTLGGAQTLIAMPPKNLFVQLPDGLQFGDQPPAVTDTIGLLRAAWRVRNNLFHGNKLYPTNRERDAALMNDVLATIDAVLVARPEVWSAFHEPQQYF